MKRKKVNVTITVIDRDWEEIKANAFAVRKSAGQYLMDLHRASLVGVPLEEAVLAQVNNPVGHNSKVRQVNTDERHPVKAFLPFSKQAQLRER